MMKLNLMKVVVDTVDDEGQSDLADQIASPWKPDAGTVKYFRSSANFVFVFCKNTKKYFLRFAHASERRKERILAEIDYLRYLSHDGIRIAEPVPSRTGNYVESLLTDLGEFHAVVFEGLPGYLMEFEELPPDFFTHWGRSLGKLHRVARGYKTVGLPTWQEHLKMVGDTLPSSDTDAMVLIQTIQNQLGSLAQNDDNFGLIHFDCELDNIVWDGEKAGIIDFDDCAYYWFAADIAFALRDMFDDSSMNFDPMNELFLKFIGGYRLERQIAQTEVDSIPLFMNLHNLITYAKIVRTLDETPAESEPAWLIELRGKLERKINAYHRNFARLLQV